MIAAVMLAGCATATQVMGPDGTPHFNVHCGTNKTLCYQKAQEVCPGGYAVTNETGGLSGITPTAYGPVGGGSYSDILIRCKAAAATPPGPRRGDKCEAGWYTTRGGYCCPLGYDDAGNGTCNPSEALVEASATPPPPAR